MNKKKLIKFGIAGILLGCYIARVWQVNSKTSEVQKQIYTVGEVVPFENDFTNTSDDASTGYTVQVLDSEIVSISDFASRYNLDATTLNAAASAYYLVKVSVGYTGDENTNERGVAVNNLTLVGQNYYMLPDDYAFSFINPNMPGTAFSLRAGTSLEMVIPYDIVTSVHTSVENIKKHKPELQLTEYPHRKMIALK